MKKYRNIVDDISHKTNERLRAQYSKSINEMITYLNSHPGASILEKERYASRVAQKYRQGITRIVSDADASYKKQTAKYLTSMQQILNPISGTISYSAGNISPSKVADIERAVQAFGREMDDLLRASSVNAISEDASSAREKKKITTSKSDTDSSIERLCASMGSRTTAESHRMLIDMAKGIPEIMGYRVETTPLDKYGRVRKVDICDRLESDYPMDFPFEGWHPNCRCRVRFIIPADMMNPRLRKAGFIGRVRGTTFSISDEAMEHSRTIGRDVSGLEKHLSVRHHGKQIALADMSVKEQTEYYIERLSRVDEIFLDKAKRIEVEMKSLPDDVMMSTTQIDGGYKVQMRESSAKELVSAFEKRGTQQVLSKTETETLADVLHEFEHIGGGDLSMNETIAKYPDTERGRIIDFFLGEGEERQALEMVTEWKMREDFPKVMKSQGFVLPADYKSHISRGYNVEVENFTAFLNRISPHRADFVSKLNELYKMPDKMQFYSRFQQLIRSSGVLKKSVRVSDFVLRMTHLAPEEFSLMMNFYVKSADEMTLGDDSSAKNDVKKTDNGGGNGSSGGSSGSTPVVRNEMRADVPSVVPRAEKRDVFSLGERNLSGAGIGVVAGAVPIAPLGQNPLRDIAEQTASMSKSAADKLKNVASDVGRGAVNTAAQTGAMTLAMFAAQSANPDMQLGEKRYIPKEFYKDRNTRAMISGVIDAAINTGEDLGRMAPELLKYHLQTFYMPWSKSTIQMHKNMIGTLSEVGEFVYMMTTDSDFRVELMSIIKSELYDYCQSLWGTTSEHAYYQGRLVFDVLTMFVGVGEIKAAMASFRQTKRLTGLASLIRNAKNAKIPVASTLGNVSKEAAKELAGQTTISTVLTGVAAKEDIVRNITSGNSPQKKKDEKR